METLQLQDDLPVTGIEVTNFPDGIGKAFDHLAAIFGTSRAYFGISTCVEGRIRYVAATEIQEGDEGMKACDVSLRLPRGMYLFSVIRDWRNKISSIAGVCAALMEHAHADAEAPCIEWYRTDDEMYCMVRVRADLQEKSQAISDSTHDR